MKRPLPGLAVVLAVAGCASPGHDPSPGPSSSSMPTRVGCLSASTPASLAPAGFSLLDARQSSTLLSLGRPGDGASLRLRVCSTRRGTELVDMLDRSVFASRFLPANKDVRRVEVEVVGPDKDVVERLHTDDVRTLTGIPAFDRAVWTIERR